MSVQAITAVLALRGFSPTEKILLVALANYADQNNRCWPSQARLADDTGLTDRSIRTLMASLERRGIIERQARARRNGSQGTDIVTLHLSREDISGEVDVLPEAASPEISSTGSSFPGSSRTDHRKLASVSPEAASAPTTFEPSLTTKEPSKRVRARTAIPEGWLPSTGGVVFAAERGIGPTDLEREIEKFVAHHTAAGKRMADWSAAWRTWVMNAADWRRQRSPPQPKVVGFV